jgi:diguanylate cyclase (GGDEF)-like protein
MGNRSTLLASGLLVFAAADVVYGLQATAETYVLGTPLDAGWAIGLALMAMWVDGATQGGLTATPVRRPATRATALAISSVAIIAGLGVLAMSSRVPVSTLALVLAVGALVAAAARAQLAGRVIERMADQRLVAAATDELTGLPNRRALYSEGYARLAEPGCRRQALLMLDLDRFKEVNDTLGHRAGDQLLIQVAARLRESLRGDDALARLGGDEFAVLLDGAGHDEALNAAARLCVAVSAPILVEGTSLCVGVSIGIALFPDDGPDLSVLLRKADIAMYKAKTSQQDHHVYSAADDVDTAATLQTVSELRAALKTDQFVLHYQPKVDLDTGEVHSVEALVRWDHPTRGLLYPSAFLSLVEESGLMHAFTLVVLAQALDQAADWYRNGHPLTVAVNISASSLVDAGLPGEVASMLAARGVPSSALQLEITEEFLMVDRDLARVILTGLREGGVNISVDDYGTGYSSLAYLRDLPIDEIKLDNSFVIPMTRDARSAALVSSTIELAHSLGLRIVAEGVETAGTYTQLTRMGCDQAQGYFMSRPVPAAELNRWLNHWQALDQSADILQLLPTRT